MANSPAPSRPDLTVNLKALKLEDGETAKVPCDGGLKREWLKVGRFNAHQRGGGSLA